jgi:hypothetical protein
MNQLIEKIIKQAQAQREAYVFAAPKGWVPWIFPTSLFIRDYLMEKREAYPFEIYQALKAARKKAFELGWFSEATMGKRDEAFVGSPINFYKYIWTLEKLGLIERTGRVEPAFRGRRGETKSELPSEKWRTYYRIAEGKENAKEWFNPQRALYERMVREKRWKAKKGK